MTQSSDPGGGVSAEEDGPVLRELDRQSEENGSIFIADIAPPRTFLVEGTIDVVALEAAIEARYAPLLAAAEHLIVLTKSTPDSVFALAEAVRAIEAALYRLRSGEGGEPKQEQGGG